MLMGYCTKAYVDMLFTLSPVSGLGRFHYGICHSKIAPLDLYMFPAHAVYCLQMHLHSTYHLATDISPACSRLSYVYGSMQSPMWQTWQSKPLD